MELIILILIEVQVNDYVTAFLSPNSLPIHRSHPSQLDNDKSNGHSLLYDCIKREIKHCHEEPRSEYRNCIELRFISCVENASKKDPMISEVKGWIKFCSMGAIERKVTHAAYCLMEFLEIESIKRTDQLRF